MNRGIIERTQPHAFSSPMHDSSVTVRQARSSEADELATLFDRYRQFQGQVGDLAAAQAFLRARLAHGDSIAFVARDGPAPIGFAQLYPSYSSVSLAKVFVLNDLYVEPAARRKGVAAKLLSAVEAFAWSHAAVRVTLNVAVTNEPGHALYEARGWERDRQFHMYHRYPPRDRAA